MNFPPSSLIMVILMMGVAVSAGTVDDESGQAPSMALLEFLGEWETEEGEWIDPELLEDEDFANLLRLTDEEAEENE